MGLGCLKVFLLHPASRLVGMLRRISSGYHLLRARDFLQFSDEARSWVEWANRWPSGDYILMEISGWVNDQSLKCGLLDVRETKILPSRDRILRHYAPPSRSTTPAVHSSRPAHIPGPLTNLSISSSPKPPHHVHNELPDIHPSEGIRSDEIPRNYYNRYWGGINL